MAGAQGIGRCLAMVVCVGLLSALPVTGASPAGATATEPVRDPVIADDWPDPEIAADPVSGRLFAFATNVVISDWVNVPVRSSVDGTDWSTFEGDALPVLPAWAETGRGLTWSPGVARLGQEWRLYFTARHRDSGRQCIGVAAASTPQGPYEPAGDGPMMCQQTLGGSIDASPFLDPVTGWWWLHWKSDENAPGAPGLTRLWAQRLAADGMTTTGERRIILDGHEHPIVENPDMVHHRGSHWLVYSADRWETSGYRGRLARCDGPAGPCDTVDTPSSPWLGNDNGVEGPGGVSFFRDLGGNPHVAFHGWTGGIGYPQGRRSTYVEPVTFDGSGGAPRIRPDLPRTADDGAARRAADTNYVQQSHRTFLARDATGTEIDQWLARLRRDLDHRVFTRSLSTSDEWIGVEVDKLYEKALGRDADPAGRLHWIRTIRHGMAVTEAGARFFGSAEFYERSGSTREGFVTELYRQILGREPDDGGLGHWVRTLADGAARTEITRWFYDSIESRRQRVHGLYRQLLGRDPDPSGQKTWTSYLLRHDDVRLAEVLAVSNEFYKRAQRVA